MSLPSSPSITEGLAQQTALPGKKRRRRWPIFLVLIALVIVIATVWQVFYQQQTGMMVGRPLASRQTHLHAVVLGGQPGVMYLGTHFGIFTSTDGGRTWPQQQNGIVWHAIPTPVATPATRLIISQDGSDLYALFGSDLWFSGDQGTNWVHRWHFTRGDMIALVINPNNPRQLFAGFFRPGLVLSSTNGGTSWQTLTD